MFSNFPCHKGERQVEGGEEGGERGERRRKDKETEKENKRNVYMCVCAYVVDNECFLLLFL